MYTSGIEVLTIAEVCEYLQISPNTAYALVRNGDIKGFKIKRHWKVSKASLEDFILTNSGLK